MKTLCTLGAALAVFGTGLICGQLMRWIGASALTVPNSPGSPAESQMKATARRNGFSTSRGKEGSGDFVTRLNVLVNTSNPYKRRRAIAGARQRFDFGGRQRLRYFKNGAFIDGLMFAKIQEAKSAA